MRGSLKFFSCTTTVGNQSQSSIVTGQLSVSRKQVLFELVEQYADVLTSKLGLTSLIEYTICVKDTKPVRLAPYSLSPSKMNFLRGHVQSLLQQGIVEPSVSTHSSPVFLVPKREGSFRAVVDYRVLNSRIDIESVPLPDVHSAFYWFGKYKYFTTLDLNQAYYPHPSHAERFNRNFKAALIAYHADAHDRRDQDLDWLQLAFNTATHESTNSTPFQTLFPFRAGSPVVNR
jgi:hypothetical protein